MRIRVNGQCQEQEQSLSVASLLEKLSLDPRRVAVELNRRLLPRAQFGRTALSENDELEIVTLVGGG